MAERLGLQGISTERLLTHLHYLCKEIGPRPPASPQERQAADYVIRVLRELGIDDITEQPFLSQDTLGKVTIPIQVAWLVGMIIARWGGSKGKMLGGLALLGGAITMRNYLLAQPPFFQSWIAQRQSQNVIVRLSPSGSVKRRVFLIGHLDTNKQRFTAPLPVPALMKPFDTASILLMALGGIGLLIDGLRGRPRLSVWQQLLMSMLIGSLPIFLYDETQPHIEGANDNGTAVSILLSLAEALHDEPLQHTEVNLLFTGCEEVLCVGMEHYLEQYGPSHQDTYWIDLEMVGTGNLCYVTKHGLTYLSEYRPAPEMVTLAERVAAKHPELGVIGKEMLIVEEVASLARRNYKAICIAGYNEQGYLPNWHRVSDTLDKIEPDTLTRAATFTWEMIRAIDGL